jgi:hypothetical protein
VSDALRGRIEALAEEWERRAETMGIRGWPEAESADMAERDQLNTCAEALRAALRSLDAARDPARSPNRNNDGE